MRQFDFSQNGADSKIEFSMEIRDFSGADRHSPGVNIFNKMEEGSCLLLYLRYAERNVKR